MGRTSRQVLQRWWDGRRPSSNVAAPLAPPFAVKAFAASVVSADVAALQVTKIRAALMAVLGRETIAHWERQQRLRIVATQAELPAAARELSAGASLSVYCEDGCIWLVASTLSPDQAPGMLFYDAELKRALRARWPRLQVELYLFRQRRLGWDPGELLQGRHTGISTLCCSSPP